MVLSVTEDTPADMLTGSMELAVQLPHDHHIQRITVKRSTAMMDLLVQIATAHKLAASSYTLQAIGEHGIVLSHQSNTPIGALDALEVKLLPKPGPFISKKTKQVIQPFETTFRLQVHLPRNQLYVSRVSSKTNLGDILDEVCRKKNLDRNKYELRHPGNHKENLDLSLSLEDYDLQEVTLYAKQGQKIGSALSSQDIMALQRQEERRRQYTKQSVFGFIFRRSKECSLSTNSLSSKSVSSSRNDDEIGRSISPVAPPPTRPNRKRRPAPNPPTIIHRDTASPQKNNDPMAIDESKEKLIISHSRNSSDSSGYHEASVLSDNPDSAGRMPETLPRRNRPAGKFESRKLVQTSQTSKSLSNLVISSEGELTHATSNTSLNSTYVRKKRAAPKPPINTLLSSAASIQALERIVDSEESLTSDMDISKPSSDIAASSEIETNAKTNSDIDTSVHESTNIFVKDFCHISTLPTNNDNIKHPVTKVDSESCHDVEVPKIEKNPTSPIDEIKNMEKIITPQGIDDSSIETDLLLQKVSTTLANGLPTTKRLSQDITSNEVSHVEKVDGVNPIIEKTLAHVQTGFDNIINVTHHSQQDTSDYMSVSGSSFTDWEYQIPDPPTEFRDNVTPDCSDIEAKELCSVEVFKEPIATVANTLEKNSSYQMNVDNKTEYLPHDVSQLKIVMDETSENKNIVRHESMTDKNLPRLSQDNYEKDSRIESQRNIISELENKIENGIIKCDNGKNMDLEFSININKSTSNIAPIENTLPNFRITTYTTKNCLNIRNPPCVNVHTQDRFLKNYGTISRNNRALPMEKEIYSNSSHINYHPIENLEINNKPIIHTNSIQIINSSDEKLKDPLKETIKISQEDNDTLHGSNKSNIIHRSKSYIVLSNNSKYRDNKTYTSNTINTGQKLKSLANSNQDITANLQTLQNHEVEFNKSQNEIKYDRELRSVEVLKEILPQLTVTQQPDINISETYLTNCHNEKQNPIVKLSEADDVSLESNTNAESTIKYRRYTGPPAISLGSWSERPCINVKIKMDTDYKLSANNNNINSNSNNINNDNNNNINKNNNNFQNINKVTAVGDVSRVSSDVDCVDYKDSVIINLPKNSVKNDNFILSSNDMRESNVKRIQNDVGITRKKITNTSVAEEESGLNNFHPVKLRVTTTDDSEKLIVGKKSNSKDDEIKIDTKSVNFKELTQTFGQINQKAYSKYNNRFRHSSYIDGRQGSSNDFVDSKCVDVDSSKVTDIKQYTSVIGIDNGQLPIGILKINNDGIKKTQSTGGKINGLVPIVKGFNNVHHQNEIQRPGNSGIIEKKVFRVSNKMNSYIPPPPLTVPVITGVTLKNNNMAIKTTSTCKEPRDQLLESIRNFGRNQLRNVHTDH